MCGRKAQELVALFPLISTCTVLQPCFRSLTSLLRLPSLSDHMSASLQWGGRGQEPGSGRQAGGNSESCTQSERRAQHLGETFALLQQNAGWQLLAPRTSTTTSRLHPPSPCVPDGVLRPGPGVELQHFAAWLK